MMSSANSYVPFSLLPIVLDTFDAAADSVDWALAIAVLHAASDVLSELYADPAVAS